MPFRGLIMKPVWPLIASLCLLFGCENIQDVEMGEGGKTPKKTSKTFQEDGKTEGSEAIVKPEGQETKNDDDAKSDVNATASAPPETSTGKPWPPPSDPEELLPDVNSPDLLKVVREWNRIPSSAFPRKVTLKGPVTFVSTRNKQVKSAFNTGQQVFVLEQLVGSQSIVVAPNESSPMRKTIPMGQTDLKEVLAYAYEVTKRRRAELALTNPPRATRPKPRPPNTQTRPNPNKPKPTRPKPTRPKPTRPQDKQPERNDPGPLFDDVPEAKAVNPAHGKWCVCPDCREKRKKGK